MDTVDKIREIQRVGGVKPSINPALEVQERVDKLVQKLVSSGKSGFILGVSGGIDSLVAGLLCQRAVITYNYKQLLHPCILPKQAELRLMRLPYGQQLDAQDAKEACDLIGGTH